jgi:SAM-dependent methyltransferase
VIEHVEDAVTFIRELVRVGAPGATYLLAVPDPASERVQIGLAAPDYFEKPNHVRVIEREDFARLVSDAGLAIVDRGHYGFYWAIWWVFFWVCRVDLSTPSHPILDSWMQTWLAFLQTPGSEMVRRELTRLMPKSQYIIARKPADVPTVTLPAGRLSRALAAVRRWLPPQPAPADALAPAAQPKLSATHAVPPSGPAPVDFDINPNGVGLHNAVESGWFHRELGELYSGFPISAGDLVLHVGCGEGHYSRYIGELGAHIIFSDVDPECIRATERELAGSPAREITPVVSDADPLPLPDASVTRVFSTGVLEHVDRARFLRELARVGKPGALYLLSVPDRVQEALQHRLAPAEFFVKSAPGGGKFRGLPTVPHRTIGRDEFEQIVSAAGLIVERHDYVGFFWALLYAFFWICNVDFKSPRHPLLMHWTRTWKLLLDLPDGKRARAPLDKFMPKNQIIVARKP